MAAVIDIIFQGQDSVSSASQSVAVGLKGVGDAAEANTGKASGFFSNMLSTASGFLAANVFGGIVSGLTGAAGAVLNFSSQSAQSINDLQAGLGITRTEAESLGDVALEVFKGNWGESLTDATTGVQLLAQQFSTFDPSFLNQMSGAAFALRDNFGVELPDSVSAAKTLMDQFGLSGQQAMDFISSGFQQGLDRSGDFLDTINEYGTQFANGGADAGQFFSLLESGLQGGALGTDKAADAFKEFRVRIQDGSTATSAGLQQLGIDAEQLGQQMASGQVTAADAFQLVLEKLQATGDESVQMQAGVALLGTQFEDLGQSGALGLSLTTTKMNDLAGATDSLNVKYNNWPSLWEGVKRSALVALEPIGASLLNLASSIMPKVQAGFTWLSTALPPIVRAAEGAIGALSSTIAAVASYAIPAMTRAWQYLQPALQTVISLFSSFTSNLNIVSSAVNTHGRAIETSFRTAWTTIQSIVQQVLSSIQGLINSALGVVQTIIQQHGGQLVSTFSAAWGSVASTITQYLQAFWSVISSVLNQVSSFISANQGQIASTFAAIWGQIGSIVEIAMRIIQATIIPALQAIATFIAAHSTQIQAVLGGAWQIISNVIQGALAIIEGVLKTALAVIQGDWAGAWTAIQQMSVSVVQALLGIVTGLLNAIAGLFGTSLSEIVALWVSNWNALVGIVSTIMEQVQSTISGALGAVIGFFVAMPGQIMQSLASLPGKLTEIGRQIVEGLKQGIANAWNDLVSWLTEKMNALPDPIRKVLGISSPSKVFAEIGRNLLEGLIQGIEEMAPTVDKKLLGFFSEAIGGLMQAVSTAFDLMGRMAGFAAPSLVELFTLIDSLGIIMEHFVAVARAIKLRESVLQTIDIIATGMQNVFDVMAGAVTVSEGIKNISAISVDNLAIFRQNMDLVFEVFFQIDDRWDGFALGFAASTVDLISQILQAVGAAAQATAQIRDISAITQSDMNQVAANMQLVVQAIVDLAAQFVQDGVIAAAEFAQSAGAIVGMVGSAIDNLTALRDIPPVAQASVDVFAANLRMAVQALIDTAAGFALAGVQAAAAFAEAAGTIVGVLGGAVQGLAALTEIAPITLYHTITFNDALHRAIDMMISAANAFGLDGVQAAADFAEAAGRIVGVLKTGVDGFTALTSEYAPITLYHTIRFRQSLVDVTNMLISASNAFGLEGVQAAAAFADAAGSIVGLIGQGVDGFLKLGAFVAPSQASIIAFGDAVAMLVGEMVALAANFQTTGLNAAQQFADTAGAAIGLLTSGVEGFLKLGEFTGVAQGPLDAFGAMLQALVERMIAIAGLFTAQALTQVRQFVDVAQAIVSSVTAGIEAFAALGEFAGSSNQILDSFVTALQQLLDRFQAVALPATSDIGLAITTGIASAIAANAYRIRDALLAAVTEAIAAAKQALGIASPSKLFAAEIGQPIAAGIAQGVRGGAPLVGAAITQATAGSVTNNYYTIGYSQNVPSAGSAAADIRLLTLMHATGAF